LPDIEVLQEVPEEIQARSSIETKGESALRGHLKAEGDEQGGSQSYVPPEAKDDKALNMALDLIRGTKINTAFPPNPNERPCRTDGAPDHLKTGSIAPRAHQVSALINS
jgi:carboxyl-terminal processing protease